MTFESRIWSALEVYRYYAPMILTTLLELTNLQTEWIFGKLDESEFRAGLLKKLDAVRLESERCKLAAIVDQADRVKNRWLKPEISIETVGAMLGDMIGAIQLELSKHLFFRIPVDDRGLYETVQLSERAQDAFPTAAREIGFAGQCIALDQWTACVLHLMRALEIPLAALVKALNVIPSSVNWQAILKDCQDEIAKIGPRQNPSNQQWKEDEQFYSEAALEFRYFKNAWRNHAMHGRDTYDPGEAKKIFDHVQSFMDHLAQRIKQ